MGEAEIELNTFMLCNLFFFSKRISCTRDTQLFFPQVTSEQAADNGKNRQLKTKFRIPLFLAGNRSENSCIEQEKCSAEEREALSCLIDSCPSFVSNQALLSHGFSVWSTFFLPFQSPCEDICFLFYFFFPKNRLAVMLQF